MIGKLLIFFVLPFLMLSCGTQYREDGKRKIDQSVNLNSKEAKRTFLGFVATWCPHCKDEMPIYDKFYSDYKEKVNMKVFVLDGKKFPGNYSIPQDITNSVTYKDLTKEECNYVPSYIIYDENKNIIEKKCGSRLTYEELKKKLLNLELDANKSDTSNDSQINVDTSYQKEGFKDGDIGVVITTTAGKLEVKLFKDDAKKTVLNFLGLAKRGYYNNSIFHRVIKDFMIQGGDPTGTGMGGESVFGKEFEDEFSPKLHNIRGSVSMANRGPNTNSSQFFINQKDNLYLDGRHSVFGQVVNGLDVVDRIASVKTDPNDRPEKDIKILKIEIVKFESGSLKPYDFSLEKELKKIEDERKAKKEADKNRVVKVGDRVLINYIGKTAKDKKEFDNSYKKGKPIEFEVGAGVVIPGLDKGILRMKIGEKRILNIKAKDGYGEYDPKNVWEVKRSDLKQFEEAGYKLEAGAKIPTMYGEFKIKEINKDVVKIDLNHPLAGKDLIFEVELVEFKN